MCQDGLLLLPESNDMRKCLSLGTRRPRPVALYAQRYAASEPVYILNTGLYTDDIAMSRPAKLPLSFRRLASA